MVAILALDLPFVLTLAFALPNVLVKELLKKVYILPPGLLVDFPL